MKSRIVTFTLALALLAGLFFTGCYKYHDDVYLDELDITLTYYDQEVDFMTYTTFAVRDSVGIYSNYLKDNEIDDFYKPGGGSEKIREFVKQKFEDMGYTYVDSDQPADFYVNLFTAFIDNTYFVGYPGWWYGYYPYYSYYYYWWYPYYGYGWYYSVYNYQSGSLLMEMADGNTVRDYQDWAEDKTPEEIQNADPDEVPEIHFVWQALVNGVAGSTAEYNRDRAERGVNEAFDQSPYLKKN
jgi:hypothetical protein